MVFAFNAAVPTAVKHPVVATLRAKFPTPVLKLFAVTAVKTQLPIAVCPEPVVKEQRLLYPTAVELPLLESLNVLKPTAVF